MKRLLEIICALAAVRAGADTLDDVKAAVKRFSAKQPVRATFSTEQSVKTTGRFANENTARIVSAEVSHDAAGVSITIPQALLDKASQEARSRNGGDHTAQNAIGSIRSSRSSRRSISATHYLACSTTPRLPRRSSLSFAADPRGCSL